MILVRMDSVVPGPWSHTHTGKVKVQVRICQAFLCSLSYRLEGVELMGRWIQIRQFHEMALNYTLHIRDKIFIFMKDNLNRIFSG